MMPAPETGGIYPLTVIIPTYRRPEQTQKAVDSVLAQTVSCLEILVVDDGSGAGKTFQPSTPDSRVRVLYLPENHGVAHARNTAIREARGKWVAFLDSDDQWLPDKIRRFAEWEKKVQPSRSFIFYSAYLMDWEGKRMKHPARARKPGEPLMDYLLLSRQSIHISTWILPLPVAQKYPFDTALATAEDWDLLLKAERDAVPFCYHPEPLGIRCCLQNPDRLTEHHAIDPGQLLAVRHPDLFTPSAKVILGSLNSSGIQDPSSLKRMVIRCTQLYKASTGFKYFISSLWTYLSVRVIFKIRQRLAPRLS